MQSIQYYNNTMWRSVEEALTPRPQGSNESRLMRLLPLGYLLPGVAVTSAFAAVGSCFSSQQDDEPDDFSAICKDSRRWNSLGHIESTLGQHAPNFRLGVSTCTFQDSGSRNCPDSQWTNWEKKCLPEENRSHSSANLFSLYQTGEGRRLILDRLQKLGVNSYRFSLEWSQIQPMQHVFDTKVLEIYVEFCKFLKDNGIEPMVTLHHFSEPSWFHSAGSFEREENISAFVSFAVRAFSNLCQDYNGRPLVEYICTINEPTVEAAHRYVTGEFSPGYMLNFEKAAIFLKTVLKAHVKAYEALKAIDKRVQIGIVHQPFKLIASNTLLYPVERYVNRLMNDAAMGFFREGRFELKVPLLCNVQEDGFSPKTDFVGLQYYARSVVGLTGFTSFHEPMTKMPWREDPEGIYEAIIETYDSCKVPIIITENGISTDDDVQRDRYMQRALYATEQAAQKIGAQNLKGYFVWSFCDNFEWSLGMNPQRFGAYSLTDGQINEEPKPGMESFIKVCNAWRLKQNDF